MADVVRVIIYDAKLDAMFRRRGMVYTHERRRARRAETIAKRLVGKRSGDLKRSIRVTEATSVRRRQTGFWIGSPLYYARWVHDGTDSPIVAKSEEGMSVPIRREKIRGTSRRERRMTVRGQRAQLYLTRARDRVMPG